MVTLPVGVALAGPAIAFTPHGTSFDAAVAITLPYDGEPASPIILRLDDFDDDTWEVVDGGDFAGGEATLDVMGFSIYVVGDGPDGTPGDVDLEADCMQFCMDKQSLGCASEPATCMGECLNDGLCLRSLREPRPVASQPGPASLRTTDIKCYCHSCEGTLTTAGAKCPKPKTNVATRATARCTSCSP